MWNIQLHTITLIFEHILTHLKEYNADFDLFKLSWELCTVLNFTNGSPDVSITKSSIRNEATRTSSPDSVRG